MARRAWQARPGMSDPSSTVEHRGPARPVAGGRRPALVRVFPDPQAVALPDSGTVLGRAWLAERGLADSEVSTAHLGIDRAGGVLRVRDLGSRNGTWVNGVRLTAHEAVTLDDGATLRFGRTLFVYRERLTGPLTPEPPLFGMVGPFGLRELATTLEALPRTGAKNVLIEGESGVGKELVARAIAEAFGRARVFAPVNVAGIARGVFESQFFGHVAGAFSDARSASPGIVLAHDGGAVFLDEIGELELGLQAKLLRLLENREVLPVGAHKPIQADVLVIAATHRDLEQSVESGEFRFDLFHRLAMVRVKVPALRERREDIFAIASELARRDGAELSREGVEVEAVERLLLEPWPGNVRQLVAALRQIRQVDPERGLRLWPLDEVLGPKRQATGVLTERAARAAIDAADGNVTRAAAQLGVSRGKLLRLMKRANST